MKKLILITLVALASTGIARKKQASPWSYYQDPFTVTRYGDTATITSPVSDGIQGPLPFTVIQGSLSDLDFRETLIFITDNLSEAFND